MSHKTVICFAIWTSFWSALFNHFYTVYFGSFGVPWIMFVCMAIFFGMNGTPKQVPGMIFCLTFSQGGGNVAGLAFTLFVGIILAMICGLGLTYCSKKFDSAENTK